MKKIAFIMGNGFDLNLKIPTRFGDFVNSPEFENLLHSNNNLCIYLNEINKAVRWIDLEKELSNYSIKNPNDDNLYSEYKGLKKAFFNYIARIDSEETPIDENSNAYMVLGENYYGKLNLPDDFIVHIVSFNYTNTFDKIRNKFSGKGALVFDFIKFVYNILNVLANNSEKPLLDHIKLFYPHGSIEDRYIIFGVQDDANISKEHIFLKKTCDPNFKKFPIRLSNYDKIIIFGHSLGESDHTYFKEFFLNQCKNDAKSKDIFISYYGEKDYYSIMKQLDLLTNQNISSLKGLNNLKLIDVSKDGAWKEFE